jgi:hypothetical protein
MVKQIAMTQIIHITPEQYDFILRVFDDKTFGGTDDLRQKNGEPVDFEVIGCGLDASLEVRAYAYHSDHGTEYAFTYVNLLTYVDGGRRVDNNFRQDIFIDKYKQAS